MEAACYTASVHGIRIMVYMFVQLTIVFLLAVFWPFHKKKPLQTNKSCAFIIDRTDPTQARPLNSKGVEPARQSKTSKAAALEDIAGSSKSNKFDAMDFFTRITKDLFDIIKSRTFIPIPSLDTFVFRVTQIGTEPTTGFCVLTPGLVPPGFPVQESGDRIDNEFTPPATLSLSMNTENLQGAIGAETSLPLPNQTAQTHQQPTTIPSIISERRSAPLFAQLNNERSYSSSIRSRDESPGAHTSAAAQLLRSAEAQIPPRAADRNGEAQPGTVQHRNGPPEQPHTTMSPATSDVNGRITVNDAHSMSEVYLRNTRNSPTTPLDIRIPGVSVEPPPAPRVRRQISRPEFQGLTSTMERYFQEVRPWSPETQGDNASARNARLLEGFEALGL